MVASWQVMTSPRPQSPPRSPPGQEVAKQSPQLVTNCASQATPLTRADRPQVPHRPEGPRVPLVPQRATTPLPVALQAHPQTLPSQMPQALQPLTAVLRTQRSPVQTPRQTPQSTAIATASTPFSMRFSGAPVGPQTLESFGAPIVPAFPFAQ